MNTIRKTTLANGTRIITEVVKEVYSASIGIWIDVGSVDENERNNGCSHCLEHMLFKGTRRRTAQQIAQEIEDVGGSLGAATGKENTGFYGRVMGSDLPVAVDILVDMLANATLSNEDLDLERQVILEEIKMYEDDPEDLVHESLVENMWPDHPLARPITGTEKTVKGITSGMLHEHVSAFYSPENMIVSIAGNFNESEALAQLEKGLGHLRPGKPKPKLEKPKSRAFSLVKDKNVEQAHLAMAFPAPNITDPKRYHLAVLDLALGGNVSSRLFQEVREKRGLVYTINSFRDAHKLGGLFGVYAGTSPKQVEQVLKLVGEELDKVKKENLQKEEITRAKVQLKSELLLGLESMRNRITRNASSELYWGRELTVEEIVADIDKVDADELNQVANEIFDIEKAGLVVVGPKKKLKESYALN